MSPARDSAVCGGDPFSAILGFSCPRRHLPPKPRPAPVLENLSCCWGLRHLRPWFSVSPSPRIPAPSEAAPGTGVETHRLQPAPGLFGGVSGGSLCFEADSVARLPSASGPAVLREMLRAGRLVGRLSNRIFQRVPLRGPPSCRPGLQARDGAAPLTRRQSSEPTPSRWERPFRSRNLLPRRTFQPDGSPWSPTTPSPRSPARRRDDTPSPSKVNCSFPLWASQLRRGPWPTCRLDDDGPLPESSRADLSFRRRARARAAGGLRLEPHCLRQRALLPNSLLLLPLAFSAPLFLLAHVLAKMEIPPRPVFDRLLRSNRKSPIVSTLR